ncbi:MAG TPA: chloride channel protein [Methanomicrobiales archaeon]|nr:chloride channel protein [Methanomicrobiales archaeon]
MPEIPFRKILLIALLVGIVSGVGSLLFYVGLQAAIAGVAALLGYRMPSEGQTIAQITRWSPPASLLPLVLVLCLGGLLSGLIVFGLAPEAEGHGTDAAIRAFHGQGRIRKRIPFLKAITAIITISTGGSAGREGPAAQISAGIGSMVAEFLGLPDHERRIALAAGIGAGIGAIFKAPLGGAILSAEILYKNDFEVEAVIPSFLASIIAYAIFGTFEGFNPIFGQVEIVWTVAQIPLFLLLGAVCAYLGRLYVDVFYGSEAFFRSLIARAGLPPHLKPFLGAAAMGVLILAVATLIPGGELLALGSMGSGYGFLQLGLYSMLPLGMLIALPFLKIATTSLTIGSGGSGGVFAPGLLIGGSFGGAVGMILHILFPGLLPLSSIPIFVVIGMIATFGSVSRAPLAVMIMVIEMTGNFTVLVPAMGAVAIAFLLIGDATIYRGQVPDRTQSPAHRGEYNREVLSRIPVGEVMTRGENLVTFSPGDPASRVLAEISETTHTGFPVVDNGHLIGMITIGYFRANRAQEHLQTPVGEAMTRNLITVAPGASLEDALQLMMKHDIHHLPVVYPANPDVLVGMLTRTDIMKGYTKHVVQSDG